MPDEPSSSSPSPSALLVSVPPVTLELVDWEALLARAPDPRRRIAKVPPGKRCRRREGADGRVRLRWDEGSDPQPFAKRRYFTRMQGGIWLRERVHFDGAGAWVLSPAGADACICRYQLVDVEPFEARNGNRQGWTVAAVQCGGDSAAGGYAVAVLDFEAALAGVAADPSRALGLALWLEEKGLGRTWYRVGKAAGGMARGALVSEPLTVAEMESELLGHWREQGVEVLPEIAPEPLRAAWAALSLRGVETSNGLVRPEPHTGCPGHRMGELLPNYLRAQARGHKPLLREEWERAAGRARQLGVAVELVLRPRPAVAVAFDPARLPGWDEAAPATRNGHRLFPFQREGILFALEQDLRCLIADEMGLGKTATAVVAALAAGLSRIVVLCPVVALGVWRREILGWSAAAGPVPVVVAPRETHETPQLPPRGWVVVGYDTLVGREERIETEDPEFDAALVYYLGEALGTPAQDPACGWSRQRHAAEKSTAAGPRKARWEFTLQPAPKVAAALEEFLVGEFGQELPGRLRLRLGQIAARLSRPVLTTLQGWGPELLIADEAHRLKDPAARRTRAARELAGRGRVMLLTGTPLRNHAGEGKPLLEMILPQRDLSSMGRGAAGMEAVLKALLGRHMIRRLKADVLPQLPPKRRQRVPVPITGADLRAYAEAMFAAEELFARVYARTGSESEARKVAMGLWGRAQGLLALAKLSSGLPTELITEVVKAKGSVIVFAHHLAVLDALERALRENNLTVGRVDGRVSLGERVRVEADFQAGRLQVFLGGIKAAGEAITLTRADTVVFVELAWVPGELLQAEDRGHRAGQQAESYHIIHLTAEFDREVAQRALRELFATMSSPTMGVSGKLRRKPMSGSEDQDPEGIMRHLFVEHGEAMMQLAWEASIENIDEHMMTALADKVERIAAVLGEDPAPVVGEAADPQGSDAAMTLLARATLERVKRRTPSNPSESGKLPRPSGSVGNHGPSEAGGSC